jgi:predicted enzyme related to lactoylglutathione lyase
MNFNSVLIGSENPDKLRDYYTKVLGKPVFDMGGYFGWQIGSGFFTVGPHDQVKGQNKEPGRVILNFETPDVKGEFEKLREAGATVVKEPYSMADDQSGTEAWIATFSDPDNNYFQLMSPMPAPESAEREDAAASAS